MGLTDTFKQLVRDCDYYFPGGLPDYLADALSAADSHFSRATDLANANEGYFVYLHGNPAWISRTLESLDNTYLGDSRKFTIMNATFACIQELGTNMSFMVHYFRTLKLENETELLRSKLFGNAGIEGWCLFRLRDEPVPDKLLIDYCILAAELLPLPLEMGERKLVIKTLMRHVFGKFDPDGLYSIICDASYMGEVAAANYAAFFAENHKYLEY